MVRLTIPTEDYFFMQRLFSDEPETWEEIKDDLELLRGWAKMIKHAGWYDPSDYNKYDYYFRIEDKQIKTKRVKMGDKA